MSQRVFAPHSSFLPSFLPSHPSAFFSHSHQIPHGRARISPHVRPCEAHYLQGVPASTKHSPPTTHHLSCLRPTHYRSAAPSVQGAKAVVQLWTPKRARERYYTSTTEQYSTTNSISGLGTAVHVETLNAPPMWCGESVPVRGHK